MKVFSIKLSEEDIQRIERLKKIYGFKTKSQLIKNLLKWHDMFWENKRNE